jgi:hypothetical protein
MNIFILDNNPTAAAQMMCDKHIPKMCVETLQMMGSALRRHGATDEQMPLTQKGTPLKGGYHNHPCTKWVGDSITNFTWTALHGLSLCRQYTQRYGKTHACEKGIKQMADMLDMIPQGPQTEYAQAMPDEYRKWGDAVQAYRDYYWHEKRNFAKWEKGWNAPQWWVDREDKELNIYGRCVA